jgi:hypothetical protein
MNSHLAIGRRLAKRSVGGCLRSRVSVSLTKRLWMFRKLSEHGLGVPCARSGLGFPGEGSPPTRNDVTDDDYVVLTLRKKTMEGRSDVSQR